MTASLLAALLTADLVPPGAAAPAREPFAAPASCCRAGRTERLQLCGAGAAQLGERDQGRRNSPAPCWTMSAAGAPAPCAWPAPGAPHEARPLDFAPLRPAPHALAPPRTWIPAIISPHWPCARSRWCKCWNTAKRGKRWTPNWRPCARMRRAGAGPFLPRAACVAA